MFLNQIDYENVIAIFIAEDGAMGEPNAFHAVHVLFLHSVLLFLL